MWWDRPAAKDRVIRQISGEWDVSVADAAACYDHFRQQIATIRPQDLAPGRGAAVRALITRYFWDRPDLGAAWDEGFDADERAPI